MSDKKSVFTDDELDDIIDEIMMTERAAIISKKPETKRRSDLSNTFDEIFDRYSKNAAD